MLQLKGELTSVTHLKRERKEVSLLSIVCLNKTSWRSEDSRLHQTPEATQSKTTFKTSDHYFSVSGFSSLQQLLWTGIFFILEFIIALPFFSPVTHLQSHHRCFHWPDKYSRVSSSTNANNQETHRFRATTNFPDSGFNRLTQIPLIICLFPVSCCDFTFWVSFL